MLKIVDTTVRQHLLCGNFGIEKEALRVTPDGHLAQTRHPFDADDEHIVRDFCENQTEINTDVHRTAAGAVAELDAHNRRIITTLTSDGRDELLWPFSNPPYLRDDRSIPIASFDGPLKAKTEYRRHLSDKYGRHKMTFSGIHFNYSFAGDLLRADYRAHTGLNIAKGGETQDYRRHVDSLYLSVAEGLVDYGWLVVALMSASPLLDSSFFRTDVEGKDLCVGMASVRCSELGYWNLFTPVLDYSDIGSYAGSIREYVDKHWIEAPSELYYPIRLKPRGANSLERIIANGISHVEIRCIDLNPLAPAGIDVRDVEFLQLLITWVAATYDKHLATDHQIVAIQNFKNAARFDLSNSFITLHDKSILTVADAARQTLGLMRDFYLPLISDSDDKARILDILDWQKSKIDDPDNNRYASIVRREFYPDYVEKGLKLARRYSLTTS